MQNYLHNPSTTNELEAIVAALRAKGLKVRSSSKGYAAQCPVHEDTDASLSLGIGYTGAVVLHCQKPGCGTKPILTEIGKSFRDLYPANHRFQSRPSGMREESYGKAYVNHWNYYDCSGNPVGYVARYEITNTNTNKDKKSKNKDYLPYFVKSGNTWKPGYDMKGSRPLYNLHKLSQMTAETVFVVEGEKCADALDALGILTTTSPGGASQAKSANWLPLLGKDVILWGDSHDTGEKFESDVIEELRRIGVKRIRRIKTELLGIGSGEDCVDWIKLHPTTTLDDVMKLPMTDYSVGMPSTGDPISNDQRNPVITHKSSFTLSELAQRKVSRVENLIDDNVVQKQSVNMIVGDSGAGKTTLAVQLAISIANGKDIFGLTVKSPAKVLYCLADGSYQLFEERLFVTAKTLNHELDENLRILNPESLPSTIEGLEPAIKEFGAGAVFLDTYFYFDPTVSENDNSDIKRKFFLPLARLARENDVAFFLLHHLGKPQEKYSSLRHSIRGASAFFTDADTVLSLKTVKGGSDEPLRLLKFEKLKFRAAMSPIPLKLDGHNAVFHKLDHLPEPERATKSKRKPPGCNPNMVWDACPAGESFRRKDMIEVVSTKLPIGRSYAEKLIDRAVTEGTIIRTDGLYMRGKQPVGEITQLPTIEESIYEEAS